MLNWLKSLFSRKTAKSLQKRSFFASAALSRLTGDWVVSNQSANAELRSDLYQLRARSRDLGRNDDYFRRYLTLLENNVLGSAGIALQSNIKINGVPDKKLNDRIEAAWEEWTASCEISGQSWVETQKLIFKHFLEDGEVLVRKLEVAEGLRLQIVDVDWLDEQYNELRSATGSNRIIMSVEVDNYDVPQAYWLTRPRYDVFASATKDRDFDRIRVPASEILHIYRRRRAGQVRGYPHAVAALRRLKMLHGYEEATLVNARVSAAKMGFLVPPLDGESALPDNTDTVDLLDQVEPGIIQELPPGYQFGAFDPGDPTMQFSEFSKAQLRGVAAGLGISYNTLASDLDAVSYSSMRAALLEDRELYKSYQQFLVDTFLKPLYRYWFARTDLAIPASKVASARNPIWLMRGWSWVDPLRDVQADVTAIEAGLKSRTEIVSESGRDFEDVVAALSAERAIAEKAGLFFGIMPPGQGDDEDA